MSARQEMTCDFNERKAFQTRIAALEAENFQWRGAARAAQAEPNDAEEQGCLREQEFDELEVQLAAEKALREKAEADAKFLRERNIIEQAAGDEWKARAEKAEAILDEAARIAPPQLRCWLLDRRTEGEKPWLSVGPSGEDETGDDPGPLPWEPRRTEGEK